MDFSSLKLKTILANQSSIDILPSDAPASPLSARSELDSVVYVLALEGSSTPDPAWGFFERVLDGVVQAMQPAPSITHVELLFAPNERRNDLHFATYLGAKAGWGASFGGQRGFYLGHNASNWKAIPVVARDANRLLRTECGNHVNTPYSIGKYVCAIPPLRALAGLFSDAPLAPAHCATLTARCVRAALPSVGLKRASTWYGPSTLVLELDSEAQRQSFHDELVGGNRFGRPPVDDVDGDLATLRLLHGTDDEIRALGEDACARAIQKLTARALEPGLDDVGRRIVQKQLAVSLLRYSVSRNN